MNALLCKLIDRWIIRVAAWKMPQTDGLSLHLDEANALLSAPDFFCNFVEAPNDFKIVGQDFEFTSPITTPWSENNIARGKISLCGENWREKPAIILLHGWSDELNYHVRFPQLATQFNQIGINAVILSLPYHFRRRPRDLHAVRNFFSPDMLRTVEATRQAVADVRALRQWLSGQGCPRLGLWGVSMGAWISGLVICCDHKIDSAILITPPARMDRSVQDLEFCKAIRRSLQGTAPPTTKFNLMEHRPLTAKENILIIEAEHDCFVPKETVEELWRAWGEPEIWRLPHGHITILTSGSVAKKAMQWTQTKLHATSSKPQKSSALLK